MAAERPPPAPKAERFDPLQVLDFPRQVLEGLELLLPKGVPKMSLLLPRWERRPPPPPGPEAEGARPPPPPPPRR